jgi:hypothetical protein
MIIKIIQIDISVYHELPHLSQRTNEIEDNMESKQSHEIRAKFFADLFGDRIFLSLYE